MTDFEIRNAEQLGALVKALKDAEKDVRREFYKSINGVTKPVRADMLASVLPSLPSRGGLAAEIHGATKLRTSATAGRNPGARIWARAKGHDVPALNRGRLRHPVYGNRRRWVGQSAGIKAGFLDAPFDKSVPVVRRELLKAIDRIAQKIYRKV